MRPDYEGGSLVNLVASVVASRGGEPLHETLRNFSLRADATNAVLFIIDGLGDNVVARHGSGSELGRRRRRALTSVFPSTTASAITTSYTGRTPLEHGLTGWFTYFGEAGCVSALLPFKSRGDMVSLSARGMTADRLFTSPSLFGALPMKSIVVTHRDIINSEYNSVHCRGAEKLAYVNAEELVAQVERAVKSSDERKFIYAYWPVYDQTCHRYGCESTQAAREFETIDASFGSLLRRVAGTDTVVIATADHGFIDVAPEESLELPPALIPALRFPLCGERRVVYCHVHAPDDFAKRAQDWLQDKADVMPSHQLVEEGWFGPGTPHPSFAERIGDVAFVMRDHYTVKDWITGESRHLHIGNHGGTHEDEMLIPLIVEEA
ncbi:MAG: alkaline phosphatase family protein [Betaproteobacteria bacterium]|nr:alkaline phosphatase family protein [Betaproteobacteria bacterium]MBV9361769.1 alkaline phosphatase family protein [Betaproteobacteria bacterium]